MSQSEVFVCGCQGSESDLGAVVGAIGVDGMAFTRVERACRDGLPALVDQLSGSKSQSCLVGCTQERGVFDAVSESLPGQAIQFFNLRGALRGQPKAGDQAGAVVAALAAYESGYQADPVAPVKFSSTGRLAVVCDSFINMGRFARVVESLGVDVLMAQAAEAELPSDRRINLVAASVQHAEGYLGAFTLTVRKTNAVDTELCTRCGACAEVCPSGAMSSLNFMIDSARCDKSGLCVKACGDFNAISLTGEQAPQQREYDLVIDCTVDGLFADRQAPLGYWHVGLSEQLLNDALLDALQSVGEFEKPKFFEYKSSICAHSRSEKPGCSACVDVCSTKAISSAGEKIEVNPHLCLGCGACTSVCPTGAIQYALSPVVSFGRALRVALKAFHANQGQSAHVVLHSESLEHNWLEVARVQGNSQTTGKHSALLPFALHHATSVGPDTWFTALAFGAARVTVVMAADEASFYLDAIERQAEWTNTVLEALGLGKRVQVIQATKASALFELPVMAAAVAQAASFEVSNNKRSRLEFAIEHLAAQLGANLDEAIALPAGAPYGAVSVNKSTCTLCMSCTSACPASALIDNPEAPQLRFIERNCVQCGLCVSTCPENAIELIPQLLLGPAAKERRVLNESQPFHCISCGKAFGTKHMIENMLGRLSGHSMFERNANRLKMCADCRVSDMYSAKDEMTIFEVKR